MAHEFKVVLDNVKLTAAQQRSMNEAIQQAVLSQIATLDLRKSGAAPLVALAEAGPTQGIYYRLAPAAEVKRIMPTFEVE